MDTERVDSEPGDDEAESSFLRRWARRKREAATERESTAPAGAPLAAEPAQPVLTDADMPPVDSLEENASVAPFFSPGVSEALRKAALRRIFRSPRFNVTDGLEDYDDDFRDFQTLGEVLTADLRHRLEQAADRDREAAPGDAPSREEVLADAGATPEAAGHTRPRDGGAPPAEDTGEAGSRGGGEQDEHTGTA